MQKSVTPTSDVELLSRMGTGDRAAFADFYDRYSGRMFGLLIKLVGRRSEAEDVLQETFWQVWSRASDFDGRRGSPLVWLVQITRSRAIDQLRRRRDHQPATAAPDVGTSGQVLDGIEREDLAAQARNAISSLPREQSAVIRLAFYGGLTHEEIARQRSIPLGTVKTRIRRGMQTLRKVLNGRV